MSLDADAVHAQHFGAGDIRIAPLAPYAFQESHEKSVPAPVPLTDYPSDEKLDEKTSIEGDGRFDDDYVSQTSNDPHRTLVRGEPVITSGKDVSDFVVDDRDDEDEALTFRSITLGTVIAGLGAALSQVCFFFVICATYHSSRVPQIYIFKPTDVSVSGIFLLLILYTFGNLWAKVLPTGAVFQARGWTRAAKVAHFINPGPFGLKEVCELYTPSIIILLTNVILSVACCSDHHSVNCRLWC